MSGFPDKLMDTAASDSATPGGVAPWVIEMTRVEIGSRGHSDAALLRVPDWRVARGDFWCVAGLPETGKTKLLLTAAGLVPPLHGEVRWFSQTAAALHGPEREGLRKRIGFVFADGGRLLPHLTVAQNVSLPLCYHRDCVPEAVADKVARLLETTGLAECRDALPARIGHGLRQRAALARALALAPEVLILDNPVSGLEPVASRWWYEFLGSLSTRQTTPQHRVITLIVAVCDLRPWVGVARRFAYLAEGTLVTVGGPEKLASSPEPGLRELLAVTPRRT